MGQKERTTGRPLNPANRTCVPSWATAVKSGAFGPSCGHAGALLPAAVPTGFAVDFFARGAVGLASFVAAEVRFNGFLEATFFAADFCLAMPTNIRWGVIKPGPCDLRQLYHLR